MSVLVALLVVAAPSWAQWAPPIGIPTPSFGLTQTAPSEPASWTGTTSATAGFYYVCPTCPNATNTANTYGHPDVPRTTIPQPLAAGSYVRLKGVYDTQHAGADWTPGTAESPIWIRGEASDVPTVRRIWEFRGTSAYTIIENIHFAANGTSANIGEVWLYDAADHIAIRHNEFSGNLERAGGIIIFGGAEHVLVWDNEVHDLGDIEDVGDQDAHAISTGDARHVWILENDVTRFSGSGIYFNAGVDNNADAGPLYVGRNTVYAGKQTGIGIKNTSDLIISENTVHTFAPSSSSTGACTVTQYGAQRIWWLFNTLYDCEHGIQAVSISGLGDGTHLYLVGNLIYDIADRAIDFWPDTQANRFIVANTIVGAVDGIMVQGNVGSAKIIGNLIADVTDDHIDVTGNVASHASTEAHHNLFEGTPSIAWVAATYTTLAAWQAATVHGDNSVNDDPDFTNAAGNDYTLQATSPAIGAGTADPGGVAATFSTLYSLDIDVDRAGANRPNPPAIGAYEYAAAAVTAPVRLPFRRRGDGLCH